VGFNLFQQGWMATRRTQSQVLTASRPVHLIGVPSVMRECAAAWHALPDDERRRFRDRARLLNSMPPQPPEAAAPEQDEAMPNAAGDDSGHWTPWGLGDLNSPVTGAEILLAKTEGLHRKSAMRVVHDDCAVVEPPPGFRQFVDRTLLTSSAIWRQCWRTGLCRRTPDYGRILALHKYLQHIIIRDDAVCGKVRARSGDVLLYFHGLGRDRDSGEDGGTVLLQGYCMLSMQSLAPQRSVFIACNVPGLGGRREADSMLLKTMIPPGWDTGPQHLCVEHVHVVDEQRDRPQFDFLLSLQFCESVLRTTQVYAEMRWSMCVVNYIHKSPNHLQIQGLGKVAKFWPFTGKAPGNGDDGGDGDEAAAGLDVADPLSVVHQPGEGEVDAGDLDDCRHHAAADFAELAGEQEEIVGAMEEQLRALGRRGRKRKRQADQPEPPPAPLAPQRDEGGRPVHVNRNGQIAVNSRVVGRLSVMMAWQPMSWSARCLHPDHARCSITGDFTTEVERSMTDWILDQNLHPDSTSHRGNRPANTRAGRQR
jgi:hypothetical protein